MDQRHFRPAQIEATANCTLHKVRFWLSDDSQFCIFTTHKKSQKHLVKLFINLVKMTEFCRKSLATSEFDMTLENYVYTVHDLQLEYLKSQLRDDEEKEKVKCTLQ